MTVTVVESHPHAVGVKDALAGTGLAVGDGEAPQGDTYPHLVFYDIPGGQLDGSLADPDADVVWAYQITSIGKTAEQARRAADKSATALRDVAVEGRRVLRNERVGGPGGIRRDDELGEPTLFRHVAIWHLHTTPS